MTTTTVVPTALPTAEAEVYASDHGIPVTLHATVHSRYTRHRLEFGTGRGVIVLARRRDCFAMVRRFRPAAGETFLELPRGMTDCNESAEASAVRSLISSTGHDLHDPLVMGQHCLDNAIYPAKVTMFYGVASNEPVQAPTGDGVESVEWWNLVALREKLFAGEIRDGHTLAGLAHYLGRRNSIG